MKKKKKQTISAEEFDKKFDAGEDMTPYLDMRTTKFVHPVQRINIDIPHQILKRIDAEANRVGVTRTSLIKYWIAERTDKMAG